VSAWAWASLVLGWLALAALAQAARRASPIDGDLRAGLAMLALRSWARLVHRLRVEGRDALPRSRRPGPLLVVANHVSGADPLLIQAACPFPIRWLMARDMRWRSVEPALDWAGVISVDRTRGTGAGVRPALRALRAGEVVGVFPEGRLGPTPGVLEPFQPGVGALVARSRCPVLPVVVQREPRAPDARSALWRPSRSRVRFLPVIGPADLPDEPDSITRSVRALLEREIRRR